MPARATAIDTDFYTRLLKVYQGAERNAGGLIERLDEIKEIKSEGLRNIQNELEAASKNCEAEKARMEAELKRKELDAELELERRGREQILEVLKKTAEEPIKSAEKKNLEDQLAALQASRAAEIKEAEERVRKSMTMTHKMELERTKLGYEKDHASLIEKNESAKIMLAKMEEDITQLRDEIAGGRELTRQVAEASGSRAINVVGSGSK